MPHETVINHSVPSGSGKTSTEEVRTELEREIGLLDIGRILLSSKNIILKFALVAAVLTAIIVLIRKPYYRAEASFLPPNTMSSGSSSAILSQLGPLGMAGSALGVKDPSQIYVGILGSRTVADELIQQFNLAQVYGTKKLSQTEKALRSHTKILSNKDSIIVVGVEDNDPKRAADLANSYLTVLHKQNDRIAFTEAGQKRLFFEQQLESEKNKLADAEVELARTQEQSGMIQPIGQTQLQFEAAARLQAEIASKEVQLAAISQAATDQNPEVVRIRSEILGLRDQLAKLERSSGRAGSGNIQVPTAKVPELTLTFVRKARDVKYHEALYELLLRQYESAKLDEARSAPLVQVVDFAIVPDSKAGLGRLFLTLLAAIIGGVAGAGWVLVRFTMRSKS